MNIIIISAMIAGCTAKGNKSRTDVLGHILNGRNGFGARFKYTEAEGSYKGIKEQAYVVQADSLKEQRELFSLAKWFDQESILLVKDGKEAELIYTDDRERVKLNWFNGKLDNDNYLYSGGHYFTALPKAKREVAGFVPHYAVSA